MLERAFIESVESGIRNTQDSRLDALVASIDDDDPQALRFPDDLPGDSFEQITSGLYAFLIDANQNIIGQSASVTQQTWALPNPAPPGTRFFLTPDESDTAYFATLIDTLWGDEGYRYTIVVAEEASRYEEVVSEFRQHLWAWLLAVIALLIALLVVLLRWGLQPLKRVSDAISAIESGERSTIDGDYPEEIKRLTDNINTLLASERNQRSRYRDSLADLAHSLKTPLAVLQASSEPRAREVLKGSESNPTSENNANDELETLVQTQVARMNQIVSHQLQRAVIASKASLQTPVTLAPLVEKIIFALKKVYFDKGITFTSKISESATFFGDEADVMEVLGNLLENAAKYGRSKVSCEIVNTPAVDQRKALRIVIEDDGPGIVESARKDILRRGARIDEAKEGQGIGLAVASDIVDSYGGQIRIETATLGGARFVVVL